MQTLTEKEVFTFDELSDEAKDTARESFRENEASDFDPCYEPFETAAEILGIEFGYDGQRNPCIRWSGFWSQGDGASFVGSYSHAPQSPARIREEFPTETRLHAIADGLDATQNIYKLLSGNRVYARITQSGSYVHDGTMEVEVSDSETGEEFDYDGEMVKRVTDLMRDFAKWIYRSLEAEYEDCMSDEAIDQLIQNGDYEFDEYGNLI